MDYNKQKTILKNLRTELENDVGTCSDLHVEFVSDLLELVNTLIGRINCYSTDDDAKLEELAKEDKI